MSGAGQWKAGGKKRARRRNGSDTSYGVYHFPSRKKTHWESPPKKSTFIFSFLFVSFFSGLLSFFLSISPLLIFVWLFITHNSDSSTIHLYIMMSKLPRGLFHFVRLIWFCSDSTILVLFTFICYDVPAKPPQMSQKIAVGTEQITVILRVRRTPQVDSVVDL